MSQSNIEEVTGKNFPKWMKPTDSVIHVNSEKKETEGNHTQAFMLHSEKQKTKTRDRENLKSKQRKKK